MSVQWCYSVIFWVLVGVFFVKSVPALVEKSAVRSMTDACQIPGCKCTEKANRWNIINCTFTNTQNVEFTPTIIPNTTMEISIVGGGEVIFQPQTFNSLGALDLIRIDGTRNFTIRKNAFLNLSSVSFLLQIQSCDRFIVETSAFKNMQAHIIIEVKRCNYLAIHNSAFSRLQDGTFHNIHYLELSQEAFHFQNQGLISHHGLVATLSFQYVNIPNIPTAAFVSSVSEINIRNSEIRNINYDAFKGTQFSYILISNSTIKNIKSGAFSDRTLISDFKLSKCKIGTIEGRAVMASMTNLTVEHSKITEIHSGAFNMTVAKASVTNNEIGNFKPRGLVLHKLNQIHLDHNIMHTVHNSFLELPSGTEKHVLDEFSFVGNEISHIDSGALNFLPDLKYNVERLKFDDNFFNQTCHCDINKWVLKLLGVANHDVSFVMNTSFCTVDTLLSHCFQLQVGLINMHNFTELVCGEGNSIKCEPYSGETKILNTKSTMLVENENSNSGFILGMVLGAVLIIAISGTIVILLIRGSIWLKRKGYCMRFRNLHYHHEHPIAEDEGTIVTIESSDKVDIPEELTPEILQRLREQLEDPATHDDAREMIERLYELFIAGDSRQDDETHLYEELGNLQHPQHEKKHNGEFNEPLGFLKMMEDKYNTTTNIFAENIKQPALAGDYSEPTDAAVHLYSELQQHKNEQAGQSNRNSPDLYPTQRSMNSMKMTFRPLPDKPKNYLNCEAGPSKDY